MNNVEAAHCPRETEIAVYLDGELSSFEETDFESHQAKCDCCTIKLNEQKRLLCALDFAFDDKNEIEKNFELPRNFTETIIVRAESSVAGWRSSDERKRSLIIIGALLIFGLSAGLIGSSTNLLPLIVGKILTHLWVIAAVLSNFCFEFGISLSVFLRVAGRYLVSDSPAAAVLFALLLIVSLVILSRLLFNIHRTDAENQGS